MEVFITFKDDDEAIPLNDTVMRWAKCLGASPCIVKVPEDMYEIRRRVLADNLAREEFYILADMLCVPGDKGLVKAINKEIKKNPDVNMFGILPAVTDKMPPPYPSGVRVIRKGSVTKWPPQVSDDYNQEHAAAAKETLLISGLFYADITKC